MSRRAERSLKLSWLAAVAAGLSAAEFACAQVSTGNFTGPDTTAFLSVDINGGSWSNNSASSPTEGWNQSYSAPAYSADPYGVSWVGWGGPTYDFGDGTQLPNSTIGVYGSSITKTFTGVPTGNVASGSITATLSAPGASDAYTTYGGGNLNSLDYGDGEFGGLTGPSYDIDMWRDFIQGQSSYNDVQSTNYLQLQLSGLNPNSKYTVDLYSYNEYYVVPTAATATPPTNTTNITGLETGWWANETTDPGNKTFTAPADEQVQNPGSGGSSLAAPAAISVITDGQGNGYVWLWGGSGQTGDQDATDTNLNGFQIAGGTPLLLGDTNGDGKVDATDLATLDANMGQTFTGIYSRGYAIGDFNNDGTVNEDDFSLFQLGLAEYNASNPAPAPEPANLAILGMGVFLLANRCREKKNLKFAKSS